MIDKAILFDGSRCVGCQACAQACKERMGLPCGTAEGNEALADGYQRAVGLDGFSPIVIALTEREAPGRGLVWEAARTGCVRCFEAPCASVCPTGALTLDEVAGLVGPDKSRCVSCGLCTVACPVAAPQRADERGAVCLCDGCANRVSEGGAPACVGACPTDALVFGARDDIVAAAHERAAVLRDRGYDRAAVLGETDQGGHYVVQVLKYGVEGHVNEPFATTEEIPWIAGARMAGPVSLAVLAAGAVGAATALAVEANKARRERSESMKVPVRAYEGIVPEDILAQGEDADGFCATSDAAAAVPTEPTSEAAAGASALEVALRKREALRARAAATPAAAAAAAAAARGDERHFVPVTFDEEDVALSDEDPDEESFFDDEWPAVPAIEGVDDLAVEGTGDLAAEGAGEGADDLAMGDAGESSTEDTGELYDLEEFQRLLKADILAHHAAKTEGRPTAAETNGEEALRGIPAEVETNGEDAGEGSR